MNAVHSESLERLIEQFCRLPGIGSRSAERMAYFVLKQDRDDALELSRAIEDVKTKIHSCSRCYNLSEEELCRICRDGRRDHSVICVVEQPKDLIALEQTGLCNWVYHVLQGRLAPLEGVTPDDLTIDALVKRIESGSVGEVVMATNPDMEGDGTALLISSLLDDSGVKITRLARGLATGSSIEFANKNMLSDAINGRVAME